jgi:hypothetical protein
MITLSWMQMGHPDFHTAIKAIFDCPNLDGATSYKAHRVQQCIEGVDREIKALRLELCKTFAKTDDKGELVFDEEGVLQFESEEDKKALEKAFMKEFSERKAELKVSKLDFRTLTPVRGIMPRMWPLLLPICDNLPNEEDVEDREEAPTNFKAPTSQIISP